MDQSQINADPNVICACGDCGKRFEQCDLGYISDIDMRLDAGATVPAGQCPDCGALAYVIDAVLVELKPDTEIVLRPVGTADRWSGTWQDFVTSNNFDHVDQDRIERTLAERGTARWGGGAAPEYEIKLAPDVDPDWTVAYMCEGEGDGLFKGDDAQALVERIADALEGKRESEQNILQALDTAGFFIGFHESGAFVILDASRVRQVLNDA